MTKIHSTKRSLIASILILCLCFTSLIGTTFAWFTDSVTSANNVIKTGNLDIKAEYTLDGETWNDFDGAADLFQKGAWEPGHTEVVAIRITNAGSLALKYKVNMNIVEEVVGKSVQGNDIILSDILEVSTLTQQAGMIGDITVALAFNGENKVAYENTASFKDPNVLKGEKKLTPDSAHYLVVKVDMPESVGNEANHDGTNMPSIEFGIDILATQFTAESDSFGNGYDADAKYATIASSIEAFFNAIERGDNVLLTNELVIDEAFVNYMNERYPASTFALGSETETVDKDAVIDGNGITVYRTADLKDDPIFEVADGYTLALSNITLDGGAVWTGETDPVLLRGTVNSGMTTTGAIITTNKGHIVLNEGAVLQNNDGANAVFPGTRTGGTLTLNGGEIINNHSAAGAIWGGGAITINSGKVNGNHGGIGGAIRIVTNVGTVLTMNGGEMNHNYSDGNGGAIWAGSSKSNNVYVLNGGEMAYNYSAATGGAIYVGYYETIKIGGTFKMHDNDCSSDLGSAIRLHDHASLVMTGGEIYNHADNSIFLNNNSASITGGKIDGNFGYSGGLGLVWGEAEVDGVINYNLSTNHNTAYLAAEFSELKFTVNEADEHFVNFNFKPAEGYTYTEGDEDKLVCLNEGYETYWDVATSTFRLRATNN